MEEKEIATSSTRTKVSTGYSRLDEALQGGFLSGSATILLAPASDEVPIILRKFLDADKNQALLVCRNLSYAETINYSSPENVKSLICSEKPVSPAKNLLPGKGIDNLTELNLQIYEAIHSIEPKRLVLDVLSDILLRHKALQTRKWLNELLERLRSREITILAVINPLMHPAEDVQAVIDLFDGNLEIFEDEFEGTLRKLLRIKWMHGIDVSEKEFQLVDLAPETSPQTVTAPVPAPFREPRWLTPLVSRAEELSRLKSAFENALANKSSVVALQGEAGVGKTRLMQELAVYSQSKNAVVLSGSASEDGLAYAPWIEITRQYIAQAPGELLRRLLGPNASELVKLVPDIAAKLGTIHPSKALGEQQDKIRFYEAVTQFFIAICKDAPLLLQFDDTQYLDQASLDLLEYFVRSTSNLRVLTVCSVPAEHEFESSSRLEQTIMKFNKQRLLETVTVKNLNKEDTANLIKQVFGEQTVSSEFADLIYQRTGGNPFFVEEVLRSLVEDGTIFRTEKGWDRKPIQEITIPKSVKNALKSRLTKLDPETLNILTTASIIGSEFSLDILREVTQTQEDTLLDRLERAITAGLVVDVPKRKDLFRFADSRIKDVLLDDIIQSRRIRHHVKIAEAMLKVYSKNLESQAEALAYHFSEGGDARRSIEYSIMAGNRNKSIHAYEQAIKDYKRAIDLIEQEEGNDQEKSLVLEKLADSYSCAGEFQNGMQCYEQVLRIFEKLRDNKACARACIGLARTIVGSRWAGGIPEAAKVLKRGLKYLEERGETESFEAASIYSELAQYYGVMDEWDEANAWCERACEVGEKTNNFGAVAGGLAMKGAFLTDTGRIDEGLPLWERAIDTALQHETYEHAPNYLFNMSMYTRPRNLPKARELILRQLDLCKRVNSIDGQANGWGYLSVIDWYRGDWAPAVEESQRALEIINRLRLTIPWFFFARGRLFLSMGELERAETDIQKAVSLGDESHKITPILGSHLAMGQLRLEQGKEEEARQHFETCVQTFKKWEFTTEPLLHIETLMHLTSIYVGRRELEKARDLAQWAKRLAEQLKSDAGLAMAAQAEAGFMLAKGEQRTAEETYLTSMALWEKAGWPYFHAKALVEYAEAITKTSPDESRKRLEEAVEIYRKLGAKRDLEKAEAKLAART